MNQELLSKKALELLGLPYAPKGEDPLTGVDCKWLIMEVYRSQGIDLPDPGKTDFADEAIRTFGDVVEEITKVVPGAIVVIYSLDYSERPDHAGIALPGYRLLHAVEKTGVVSTRMDMIHYEALRKAGKVRYFFPRETCLSN